MTHEDHRHRDLAKRILDRWPTPNRFYVERDDRTRLALPAACSYADRVVEIFVDPDEADLLIVQIAALVACNLTARWARQVVIYVPEKAPLCEETRRDNNTFLDQRLSFEMKCADPFGAFDFKPSLSGVNRTTPNLRIFVGNWSSVAKRRCIREDDFVVSCAGWSILGNRGKALPPVKRDSRSFAPIAGLAGSLAAADLFKRAIGQTRSDWLPAFVWDVKNHRFLNPENALSITTPFETLPGLDVGHMLLAGAGAIGSSLVYTLDMMKPEGRLSVLDRDRVETSNLNRSPVFSVYDALLQNSKTAIMEHYLKRHADLVVSPIDGTWHEHGRSLATKGFDVWFSFTNEDGAWAEVPFQLPPVVFQATTTSGWGFGAGRHIPRIEDCTLCRLPKPETEFRGPCSEGDIAVEQTAPIRAALPFLSMAAGSLVLTEFVRLILRSSTESPNEISADLRYGFPAIATLKRLASDKCRGCGAMMSPLWEKRGGLGRFRALSKNIDSTRLSG